MKYFGLPNQTVIDYKKQKKVFMFNENGEYETQDTKLIEWMKKNKNFIRCEETKKLPADGLYNCKKCDFSSPNKGDLLAHYRKEHPKAGD
jgi:hypothetical protein